jgi:hypothetical protein
MIARSTKEDVGAMCSAAVTAALLLAVAATRRTTLGLPQHAPSKGGCPGLAIKPAGHGWLAASVRPACTAASQRGLVENFPLLTGVNIVLAAAPPKKQSPLPARPLPRQLHRPVGRTNVRVAPW